MLTPVTMANLHFLESYPSHVSRLKSRHDEATAFEAAVGGDFMAVGKLERALLRSLGLGPEDFVVDVGCGSGRLALQLSFVPTLRYLGIDVVPDLLAYARRICGRADWDFLCTSGTKIPCPDESADFVCFFSVFTHLKHEETFRYLAGAKRVLKPTGRIVFSFLEFRIYSHWEVFDQTLKYAGPTDHLNQFMDRDAISAWAHHLGLQIDEIADGDRPHIPLDSDIAWSDGRLMSNKGSLGQSIAVLSKPRSQPLR